VALVVLAGARPAVPGVRDADVTTCVGMATYTAVGPYQAHARGALFSLTALYSILGGTVGTVAVKRGLLGLSKPQLREYGKKIFVFPQDSGMLTGMGGPRRPFTVSDFGDRDVQDARGERFDVYRWASRGRADEFGVRKFLTKITFPAASGGMCPPGWMVSP
jgi:hypothetical protein